MSPFSSLTLFAFHCHLHLLLDSGCGRELYSGSLGMGTFCPTAPTSNSCSGDRACVFLQLHYTAAFAIYFHSVFSRMAVVV